jgi:hypothetical protein
MSRLMLIGRAADGLRSPGLQHELLALEQRQAELTRLIATTTPSAPRFHPRLADICRDRVANLRRALSEPATFLICSFGSCFGQPVTLLNPLAAMETNLGVKL